ncbi:MAG: hypothetical protein OEM02_12310 [Desulfobulbaceae bacterium]|nr:hypothetical protein [Desulfobulbaceae bacterium]
MSTEYQRTVNVFGQNVNAGPIILHDDMETLLKWVAGGSPGTPSVTLDDTIAYNGNKSLKLLMAEDAPVEDNYVTAYRHIVLPRTDILFLRFLVMFSAVDNVTAFQMRYAWDDLTANKSIGINIDYANEIIQYQTGASSFADITGANITLFSSRWIELQIAANLATGYYLFLQYANKRIDMTSYPIYSTNTLNSFLGQVYILSKCNSNGVFSAYIDDLILAEMEI